MEKIPIKRGRPNKLSQYARAIAACKAEHRDWSASRIHDYLYQAVFNKEKRKYRNWTDSGLRQLHEKVTKNIPGKSSMQKFLRVDVIPNLDKPSELENRWHLGLESESDISPEAVPYILKVLKYRTQKLPSEFVTIRQARWISRLFAIKDWKIKELALVSNEYALYQKTCAIAGLKECDTFFVDQALLGDKWPAIFHEQASGLDMRFTWVEKDKKGRLTSQLFFKGGKVYLLNTDGELEYLGNNNKKTIDTLKKLGYLDKSVKPRGNMIIDTQKPIIIRQRKVNNEGSHNTTE